MAATRAPARHWSLPSNQIAVIQVGADNPYGHPAPAVLEALRGRHVLRTDEDGAIEILKRRNPDVDPQPGCCILQAGAPPPKLESDPSEAVQGFLVVGKVPIFFEAELSERNSHSASQIPSPYSRCRPGHFGGDANGLCTAPIRGGVFLPLVGSGECSPCFSHPVSPTPSPGSAEQIFPSGLAVAAPFNVLRPQPAVAGAAPNAFLPAYRAIADRIRTALLASTAVPITSAVRSLVQGLWRRTSQLLRASARVHQSSRRRQRSAARRRPGALARIRTPAPV
jgi:hypothetical protein